jgi:hypothetical protein
MENSDLVYSKDVSRNREHAFNVFLHKLLIIIKLFNLIIKSSKNYLFVTYVCPSVTWCQRFNRWLGFSFDFIWNTYKVVPVLN